MKVLSYISITISQNVTKNLSYMVGSRGEGVT